MIDFMHAQTPIDPAKPVLVPGDPEVQARKERSRDGIPIAAGLIEDIRKICERSGATFLLG